MWYGVLLPFGRAVPLGGDRWCANLIAICLASVSVALLFRKPIRRAEGWAFHALAAGLPAVGAFLFGIYVVLGEWLYSRTQPGAGVEWPEALTIPFYFVACGACGLCFVTVPMGYLSQRLMQWAGRLAERPSSPDPAA